MGARVRPLTVDDRDALAELDEAYAREHALEPALTLASANFHARSGHSFVIEREGGPAGFVLAHAVWNGVRPVVRATRLACPAGDEAAVTALVETLTKSAYDAAVYDLEVEVPDGDGMLRARLQAARYRPAPSTLFRRTLGSRGRPADAEDDGGEGRDAGPRVPAQDGSNGGRASPAHAGGEAS